jgi:hypothetical protein
MGVNIRLEGSLVARAGARQAYIHVPDGSTVVDVINQLAERYGPQVRPALLDGDRLRSDTVAIRESPAPPHHIGTESRLKAGDTVRFELQPH